MSRLVHTGNVIVDLVLTVDALPPRGGDVLASSSTMTAGGAFNTLVAAQRDGLRAVYAGARGSGPFAAVVEAALAEAGIDALGSVVEIDTGYSVVLVDSGAERTFVTQVGAEGRLTRQDLDRVTLGPGDLVVVSGYSIAHSPDVVPGWVAGLGPEVRVVFDPSPLVATLDADALAAVVGRADVVTANAREAHLLLARLAPAGEWAEMDAAETASVQSRPLGEVAAALAVAAGRAATAGPAAAAGRAGAAIVVRAGADGCWVAEQGAPSARQVPGFPSRVLETTGAGDAHCGVLCAGLARGASLVDAARRANAAASIAVSRRGPATAPVAAEIEALLAGAADPA